VTAITELREALDITRETAAAALKTSVDSIRRWEAGHGRAYQRVRQRRGEYIAWLAKIAARKGRTDLDCSIQALAPDLMEV
jgi:hypothetical protein